MRTMIGFTPGPEMPPYLLPIAGRNVSVLILSPRMVLAMTSASAPAASAAFAIATTSPALGDSLHHTGFLVALRMRLITLKVWSSCMAKLPPPGLRVGHEILTSMTSTSGTSTSRVIASKSSAVWDLVLKKILNALGRQADRIDHAAFELGDAGRRITDAEFARHRFRHQRAKPVDVHHLGEFCGESA